MADRPILTSIKRLTERLDAQIASIDGAMITMIQGHDLQEKDYRGDRFADWPIDLKGNNDLLSITQPKIIADTQKDYLEAGVNIIETNTLNSNAHSMADYDMQDLVH